MAASCHRDRSNFFWDTQRGLRMVTDSIGIVVIVTDTGDTTPLPPPPATPPTWRPYDGQPVPSAPATPPPATRPSDKPSRRVVFAGSLVAASLLVGGGAGVGGAAAYSAWHDEDSSSAECRDADHRPRSSTRPSTPAADGSVEAVAAKVLPSVVKIDVSGAQGAGSGSGIILSSDGQILTNNHVVELAGDGGTLRVTFNDGSHTDAKVLGTDPLTDTALIQAEDVSGLTPATIGKSGELAVGQGVVAIGSPLGLEADGHQRHRQRAEPAGRRRLRRTGQQHRLPGHPDRRRDQPRQQRRRAGRPRRQRRRHQRLDRDRRAERRAARAATSASASRSRSTRSCRSSTRWPTARPRRTPGSASRWGRHGAQGQPGLESDEGAQIQQVNAGSTAENAGITRGDVITKVDDHLITDADSLVATIRSYRPGDKVTVTYVRDGETQDRRAHPRLGLGGVQQLDRSHDAHRATTVGSPRKVGPHGRKPGPSSRSRGAPPSTGSCARSARRDVSRQSSSMSARAALASVSPATLATALAGCGSDDPSASPSEAASSSAAPQDYAPTPTPGPTRTPELDAIGVIGHSGATGYDSERQTVDVPANSWITGTNPEVDSIYRRLLAEHPAIKGHNWNEAMDGSSSIDPPAPGQGPADPRPGAGHRVHRQRRQRRPVRRH